MSAPVSSKSGFLSRDDSGLHARLETDRLVIRSLEDGDFSHVLALQTNDQVMKFVGAGGVRPETRVRAEFDEYRNLWRKGSAVSAYAIFSKNSDGLEGEFMGLAALEEVSDKGVVVPAVAEPMIYFMPQFWRGGFGKEAGKGFIDLVCGLIKSGAPLETGGSPITKLIATATPENTGSIKLQQSLGFDCIGDKECEYMGGRKVTKKLFELDLSKILEKPSSGVASASLAGEGKSSDGRF